MLVVSRKPGEHLTIVLEDGREIDVMLVSTERTRDGRVKIGIEAPRTIGVFRTEIMAREATATKPVETVSTG